MITSKLAELVEAALTRMARDGLLHADAIPPARFERPKRREHGDWSTNVAMIAGKGRGNPRQFAQGLIDRLPDTDLVEKVEVAGPGFLNFYLSPVWLHDVVRRAARPGSGFGRTNEGAGITVNLEYVSANPTGRMNVVTGRHAAVGDAVGNLLEATGHAVTREYYFNDAGRQMVLFYLSVAARYRQEFGRDVELPEDGYMGQDIVDVAKQVAAEVGDSLLDLEEGDMIEKMRKLAMPKMLAEIKASLERFGTRFDVWFSERTLHEKNEINEAIERLRKDGYIEDREGAVWFRSTAFGDDKDRVVIRSNGEPTYFAADIGYVLDKFGRGFDRLIYQWGADHHGTIPRFLAAVEALGYSRDAIEIPLIQMVSLVRGGEAVTGSKRAGVTVPLDELVDEIGVDAARYTYLTRSMDAPLEFDIELAKEQAPENPVYYVQYAHARICSILRKAADEGYEPDPAVSDLTLLVHEREDELMRKLASYEEVVPEAAEFRAPQRIARFVEETASVFSGFYRDCRVVSEDKELTLARLSLCLATKTVIADGLSLLGVSAPERM